MLLIPLALGFVLADTKVPGPLWVAAGMLLLFFARSASVPATARFLAGRNVAPTEMFRRFAWTTLYGIGGALCFLAAVVPAVRAPHVVGAIAAPLGLGVVHAALGLMGRDRSIAGELVGMGALASATPLVAVAGGRIPDRVLLGAAVLAFSYFASSLAFVRSFRLWRESGRMPIAACATAHAAIGLVLVGLFSAGWMPALALGAFVPVVARTARGLLAPPRNLRILGWWEVAVAVSFFLLAAAAFAR